MSDHQKYIKYKSKYLKEKLKRKNTQRGGYMLPYNQLCMLNGVINSTKGASNLAAYELLNKISDKKLSIVTIESLTAGLIFSTLVDIPFAGASKYGCFGVYDTNAKRVFTGVSVDNVYTHKCAKEMAVGGLRNSNATLAIAVTGNAMPVSNEIDNLGEVFIGIAGYVGDIQNPKILVSTSVHYFCDEIADTCKTWISEQKYKKARIAYFANDTTNDPIKMGIRKGDIYAPSQLTELISTYVRHRTAQEAFSKALEFVKQKTLIIPQLVTQNLNNSNNLSTVQKFGQVVNKIVSQDDLTVLCDHQLCDDTTQKVDPNKSYLGNI